MKLRIRLKEPKIAHTPRSQVRCPLCGHGTWNTHLEKHLHNPDCVLGQRRAALYRRGLEPASAFFPSLKKAGVPLEKHPTDRITETHKDPATGKWVSTSVDQERYWAPRWALAVCCVYEKQQRMMFFGAAATSQKRDRTALYAALRAMMAQPPELQEVFVAEARVFYKAGLWHEEEDKTREEEAAQASQAGA